MGCGENITTGPDWNGTGGGSACLYRDLGLQGNHRFIRFLTVVMTRDSLGMYSFSMARL